MTSVSNKSPPVVQALSNCKTLAASSLRMDTVTSPVATTVKAITATSGPASALARKRRLELLRSSRSSSGTEHNLKSIESVEKNAKSIGGIDIQADKKIKLNGNDILTSEINVSKSNAKGRARGKNNSSGLSKAKAKTPAKPKRKVKTNIRYDPDVPMSKEETAAWRREARRVRNRESAAASRQKTKIRIEELENELQKWKDKYNEAQKLLVAAQNQGFSKTPTGTNSFVLNSNQVREQLDQPLNKTSISVSIPQLQEIQIQINSQTNNQEQQQTQKQENQVLPHNQDQSYITNANPIQYNTPSTSHAITVKAHTDSTSDHKGSLKTETNSVLMNTNENTSQTIETSFAPATMPLPSLLCDSTNDLQVLTDEHEHSATRPATTTEASTTATANLEQNIIVRVAEMVTSESSLKNDTCNHHGVQDSTIPHDKQIDNNENHNQDGNEEPSTSTYA